MTGILSAVMLAVAPSANAATIPFGTFDASPGHQSRTWKDEDYSQVYFDYCQSNQGAPSKSLEIELRMDNTAWPDHSWGSKTFTKCFSSFGSSGEWHDLVYGDQFFRINKIDNGSAHNVHVYGNSYADTTKAD
ncbi:hypothetical protein [Streptomyces sp. NPDC059371]|uniref:hypothetical protein n=1 Tax=Streptomyces sp. NPDC059371 TaxID=3346812 RepID=UPI0036BC44F9